MVYIVVVGVLMDTTVDDDEICASLMEFAIEVVVNVVVTVSLLFNAFMALMYFLWKCVCGVTVADNVFECVLVSCVETALITLVLPFVVVPLFVDTITGFMVLNEDDVFGITVDFCGKFDIVLYSITELPLGLK